jgi:hypothetical protein
MYNNPATESSLGRERATHTKEKPRRIMQTPTNNYQDHDTGSSLMYLRRAQALILDWDLAVPDVAQFERIVLNGLRAQELLFSAASRDPTTEQLRHFFDEFVRFAMEPHRSSSQETSSTGADFPENA